MKILILEDESRNARRLARILRDIDPTHEVVGPLSSVFLTKEYFRSNRDADVILADIQLSDGLSFEALKSAPSAAAIIFTTAYDQYAIQAFKYNSFDYLLKPIDEDELAAALDKVVQRRHQSDSDTLQQIFQAMQTNQCRYRERFLIPHRDGYRTVSVADINHIETENKLVYLRLNDGTSVVVNLSMDELEQQLDPSRFFRANRQYIINAERVKFIGNYFGGKLIIHPTGYPSTQIIVSKEKSQRLKD